MWRRWFAGVLLAIVGAFLLTVPAHAARTAENDTGDPTIYFFWGEGCPHCAAAKPFLASLQEEYPQLEVQDYEVYNDLENREIFTAMADKWDFEVSGVPTFFLGEDHWVGFAENPIGDELEQAVAACVASGCPDAGAGVVTPAEPTTEPTPQPQPTPTPLPETDGVITLPIIGEVDAANQSLALTTALIALVDGFNPCSLWVLSVLLALTLRTGSRGRVVTIGLVFIFVTALVYALFIAGMFTVLTVVNISPWVRILVALVALAFAAVNIKDYFWFKEGLSFTIPDSKKSGIYSRIRSVSRTDSMPALIGGTVVLAAGVSVVELACTAGFPVLWTNILTAQEVGVLTFVLLLLLYMLIYQLDELAIFGVAVVTLRASKLEEKHGRILKLVGGMLMLTLAVVMIVDPTLMSDIGTALLIFGIAVVATLLVLLLHRVVLPRFGIHIGTEDPTPVLARTGRQARVDSRGKPISKTKPRGR
jgi:thiol-disulfide isomerase/thioredoxin